MEDNADLASLNGVLRTYERILTFLIATLPEHEYTVFKEVIFREDTYLPENSPGQVIENSEMRRIADRILPVAERLRRAVG